MLICQIQRSHYIVRRFCSSSFDAVVDQFSRLRDRESSHPIGTGNSIGEQPSKSFRPDTARNSAMPFADVPSSTDIPNVTEIEAEVTSVINSLLEAQNVWTAGKNPSDFSLDDPRLTPAQQFYLENKELLLKRMSDYSVTKAMNEYERVTKDIEDEWAFYRDPVVRPDRGKLWPIDDNQESQQEPTDEEFDNLNLDTVRDHILDLLRREHVEHILALDLQAAGRRDIGEYAIVGTVRSYTHGDRVGRLACRIINKLNLENMKSFSNSTPGQEWIVVRLGSVVLHLMTAADRDRYSLEDLYAVHTTETEQHETIEPNSTDRLDS